MNSVTLEALAAFPAQLEAHYGAIPQAFKSWRPAAWAGIPSEELTAIEQIGHVRDIEIDGYQARFQRTLTEMNPFLGSLDTYGLAKQRNYAAADVDKMFAEFRTARTATIKLLAGLTGAQLSRPAEFEGYGKTTLQGLVHYLCSHDQQHLAGLQWLAGQIESKRLDS